MVDSEFQTSKGLDVGDDATRRVTLQVAGNARRALMWRFLIPNFTGPNAGNSVATGSARAPRQLELPTDDN